MPLADFSPDQLEERTRTGQSMLFMVTQDLYIYVGAGEPVSIYADYFLSVLTGVAGCVCAHTCVCLSGICTQPCYRMNLGMGSHRSPAAMGRVDRAARAIFRWTAECPLWISWHMTTKITTQLILLRTALAPVTAGQMGHILKEYIAIAISHRLLSGDSLSSLTTRSEFRLTEGS